MHVALQIANMHETCYACNTHVTCMKSVRNPSMLQSCYMKHACTLRCKHACLAAHVF